MVGGLVTVLFHLRDIGIVNRIFENEQLVLTVVEGNFMPRVSLNALTSSRTALRLVDMFMPMPSLDLQRSRKTFDVLHQQGKIAINAIREAASDSTMKNKTLILLSLAEVTQMLNRSILGDVYLFGVNFTLVNGRL